MTIIAQSSADVTEPRVSLLRTALFQDESMGQFFNTTLGWAPTGGLDIGQSLYVASRICDGDADSWVSAFAEYGFKLNRQADAWKAKGWGRQSGEARLQAFASYRAAWQFAEPASSVFAGLYAKHQAAFAQAMDELQFPSIFFSATWQNWELPGVFLRNPKIDAPVLLVIGGTCSCFEELFLTLGRSLFDRGYSVALVDLPGQGKTAFDSLFWSADAELPVAAVVDKLRSRFGVTADRTGLIGLGLGGYVVARAARDEGRFTGVAASIPLSHPAAYFMSQMKHVSDTLLSSMTTSARRSHQFILWRTGTQNTRAFLEKLEQMVAHPDRVSVPFLTILGSEESAELTTQAISWHEDICSENKSIILLDSSTGAAEPAQKSNPLRLTQEVSGWFEDLFENAIWKSDRRYERAHE